MFRFISISDSLPKSPNIKLVEIWLLFSLVQPFIDVLLQSYVHYLLDTKNNKSQPARQKKNVRYMSKISLQVQVQNSAQVINFSHGKY